MMALKAKSTAIVQIILKNIFCYFHFPEREKSHFIGQRPMKSIYQK